MESSFDDVGSFYNGLSGKSKDDFGQGSDRFITYMNVYKNTIANPDGCELVLVEDGEHQNRVEYGDILFTQSSETLEEVGLSSVWLHKASPFLNSFCFGFHFKEKGIINPRFIAYGLRTSYMREQIIREGQGATRYNLSSNRLKPIKLVYPSYQEQSKVASLMSCIEKRIEKQQELICTLKKYKRGAIDGLLSRKLHFQTTSSWREIKISELFSPISEKGYDNLTVLTIVQGVGTQPRESVERRISYDKSNTNTYKRVLENDFILHLRSFEGGLEIANSEGIVSPAYTILRAKEHIIPLFYYAYFRSYWFISNKLRIAVEGIRDGKSINMETFWNIVVPYPPIEEQKHIAEYLLCLDTKLKKAEAILDRLKAIKSGFSQQLFI